MTCSVKFFDPTRTVSRSAAGRESDQRGPARTSPSHRLMPRGPAASPDAPRRKSASSARTAAGTAPARISRWSTVATPAVDQDAEPSGADRGGDRGQTDPDHDGDAHAGEDDGKRQRQLDRQQPLPVGHAEARRRLDDGGIDRADAGVRVPQDGQDPVDDEGDDRGPRPDPAEQRNRDQEPEEREARDRLDDVGGAEDRAGEPRPAGQRDAEGNADRDRDRGRRGDEENVLPGEGRDLAPALPEELRELAHVAVSTGSTNSWTNSRTNASAGRRRRSSREFRPGGRARGRGRRCGRRGGKPRAGRGSREGPPPRATASTPGTRAGSRGARSDRGRRRARP